MKCIKYVHNWDVQFYIYAESIAIKRTPMTMCILVLIQNIFVENIQLLSFMIFVRLASVFHHR